MSEEKMFKQELIDDVARRSNLTKKDVTTVINCFQEAVIGALKNGKKVTLVGFGTFMMKERKERVGRNPQTGEKMTIPASKVVAFRKSKKL